MSEWRYNDSNSMWINLDLLATINIIKYEKFYVIIAEYANGTPVTLFSNSCKKKCERWLKSFLSGIKEELVP